MTRGHAGAVLLRVRTNLVREFKKRRTAPGVVISRSQGSTASQVNSAVPFCLETIRPGMDFDLPPTLPAGGIAWEKVLPPLIPRLNGTYGQYKWSPKLLMPETDSNSSTEVGHFQMTATVRADFKSNCMKTDQKEPFVYCSRYFTHWPSISNGKRFCWCLQVHCDEMGFTVKVDVKDFNPGDLTVKVIGEFVEVQGKHEEKKVGIPGGALLPQ